MIASADLPALLTDHGIVILALLAIVEGPIVTVIAAWLASRGILDLRQVIVCVILADLVGDSLLYLVGRFGLRAMPVRWRTRLGLPPRRLVRLVRLFRQRGPMILVFGKLTHAAGLAILIAAGAARMPFASFLMANLIGTVPKSLSLAALGYVAGAAYGRIADWLFWASAAIVVALIAAALMLRRRLAGWLA
jgi:membrane-associated protein